MKAKIFLDAFPYGYRRRRNQNGCVALTLDTEGANGYVFVKKIPKCHRIPPINQREMDSLQANCHNSNIIIDWYNDETCRYFVIMRPKEKQLAYKLVLNAIYGEETFELIADFFEKEGEGYRKRIYDERFRPKLPADALITETDFTRECYDIIFPDDPLSHCRRLANVIVCNTPCATEVKSHQVVDPQDFDDNINRNMD